MHTGNNNHHNTIHQLTRNAARSRVGAARPEAIVSMVVSGRRCRGVQRTMLNRSTIYITERHWTARCVMERSWNKTSDRKTFKFKNKLCHGKIFNNTSDEKTLKFNNKMCQGKIDWLIDDHLYSAILWDKIFNKTSSSSTQTFNKNFIMFISIAIIA